MSEGPLGVCSFQKFSAFWTKVFKFFENFEMEGKQGTGATKTVAEKEPDKSQCCCRCHHISPNNSFTLWTVFSFGSFSFSILTANNANILHLSISWLFCLLSIISF